MLPGRNQHAEFVGWWQHWVNKAGENHIANTESGLLGRDLKTELGQDEIETST